MSKYYRKDYPKDTRQGLSLAYEVAAKDWSNGVLMGVRVSRRFIYATDNFQMIRYRLNETAIPEVLTPRFEVIEIEKQELISVSGDIENSIEEYPAADTFEKFLEKPGKIVGVFNDFSECLERANITLMKSPTRKLLRRMDKAEKANCFKDGYTVEICKGLVENQFVKIKSKDRKFSYMACMSEPSMKRPNL